MFHKCMVVQKNSVNDVVARCRRMGTRVVAGGPLLTTEHESFTGIDHFVLGEAENILPALISDLINGAPGVFIPHVNARI